MGKKSRRRRKLRKQIYKPKPQPQINQAKAEISIKKRPILAITGLVLGVLGLLSLIGLRPLPYVSPGPQIDPNDLLTSRFTVTNNGVLQLNDVHAICFLWKVEATISIKSSVVIVASPTNAESILAPNDGFTVPCEDRDRLSKGPIRSADLAIAVLYRPWPFTFIHKRKLFRFAATGSTPNIVWDRQPPFAVEKDFDSFVNMEMNQNLPMFK